MMLSLSLHLLDAYLITCGDYIHNYRSSGTDERQAAQGAGHLESVERQPNRSLHWGVRVYLVGELRALGSASCIT
jgi:hypothetical protein